VWRICAAETELANAQFLDSTGRNPMPKDNQTDPRKSFVPAILPWLLGAGMFAVYFFTLNHWVTLLNLDAVAKTSGFMWQPQIFAPLTYLVTLPLHLLSPANVPMALNFVSALCAALTLVLLARCVAILPQDRSEPQREREKSDYAFLTGWQAWFPPVFAVLMLGLQLTFWQHATNFTGSMVAVLLFAVIVWLLLEYRLDESEWRLAAAAVAVGAGMTEDWAFVGFAPVFLAALIWLKKLEFFSVRFLTRIILWGLAGLLFFFLLPLVAKCTADFKVGIWEAMRMNIRGDWMAVKSIKIGAVRASLAQASLSTLLPVLLMSLRWSASFGDNSRMGTVLASNMFHFVQAAVFSVCVWVMFDSPFSPQQLLGSSALPLTFLSALSIGYAWGYFLLVFSRPPAPTRRNPNPLPIFPRPLMWLAPVIVVATFACAVVSVGTLIYKNKPIMAEVNNDVLLKFSQLSLANLPKSGAVLLCDSDAPGQDQPLRATLLRAATAKFGRTMDFPILDTAALNWSPYHKTIHRQHPDKIPLIVKPTDMGGVAPIEIFGMIDSLVKSNSVSYLHPSYGYYFERFYQEPHGLSYAMKLLSDKTLLPPALDKNLIAENESFWTELVTTLGPSVDKALAQSLIHQYDGNTLPGWLLMHLHAQPVVNQNAIIVGMFCSRSLDAWGVQLQRAGELEKAAQRFQEARRFNPDNIVADINLAFNETLRAGKPLDIDLGRVSADNFGKYRNWNTLVTANGPLDDLTFCFEAGFQMAQNGFFRQSAREFERVRQLDPKNLIARLQLAQIYLLNRLPERALDSIREPLTQPALYGLNENNSTGLSILAAAGYFQKDDVATGVRLLETEVARHPDDNDLLTATTQAFFNHGLYTNALRVIDRKLARTPDDHDWLFGRGYACIQMGAYEDSIKAMTRVLQIATNNESARFNRALAYLQSDQLDAARADYRQLQLTYTNAYPVAYGLAEIAWRKKENAESLRNYQIYLANAPTNTPEFSTVRERLRQLGGK
jgi:Flp pilus assembly protein TadD